VPTSDKQIAANRANAAKSTGLRAHEGKARSPKTPERLYRRAIEERDRLRALRPNYQRKPFPSPNPKKTNQIPPRPTNPFRTCN
jgi:hypothetical protein